MNAKIRRDAERQLEILRKLTKLDPDMTVTQFQCLLEVALSSGELLNRDVSHKVGISGPASLRALDLWGEHGLDNKSPRNFVVREVDPQDRRNRILHLTATGEKFLKDLGFGRGA